MLDFVFHVSTLQAYLISDFFEVSSVITGIFALLLFKSNEEEEIFRITSFSAVK